MPAAPVALMNGVRAEYRDKLRGEVPGQSTLNVPSGHTGPAQISCKRRDIYQALFLNTDLSQIFIHVMNWTNIGGLKQVRKFTV
ncbi:hypothetical protein DPEC_G00085280 [Dallia pectoralis]|uniref:Uncharacterized protein n=1 Tax=Dallia pectoralis TaxID=75939 RepID=A0ACC2GZP4_DALPE|nr:hypothetical protein DPEC_G00085280 [Dallia pectoralis]